MMLMLMLVRRIGIIVGRVMMTLMTRASVTAVVVAVHSWMTITHKSCKKYINIVVCSIIFSIERMVTTTTLAAFYLQCEGIFLFSVPFFV